MITLDPDYAYARALRCWAYTIACGGRFISTYDAKHVLPDAYAYALLDSGSGDATSVTYAAHTVTYLDQGAEIGVVAIRKAKSLNPNSVTVLCSSEWLHAYIGQFETALRDIERALRLNPLDPNTGFVRSALGPILLGLGRVDEAVVMLEQSYYEAPTYGSTLFSLLHCYWLAERFDDAKRMGKELLQINPSLTLRYSLETTPFKDPAYLLVVQRRLAELRHPRRLDFLRRELLA
ncbi:MAG: tetratricopeptide (TPR) repeat protein [Yoonia sp.]